MKKVSSSNGLEKCPKLRFPEFKSRWIETKFSDLYVYSNLKNDLSFGTNQIISVANMYYKEDSKISDEEYLRTYFVFKVGDIAFEGNKSKDYSHGRFVENTIGDGIVSHVFNVLRPININHNIQYWKYAINNENVMGRILSKCTKKTTMMTNLVVNDFLNQFINCPSEHEQQKIADFLTMIDQKIEKQQQLVELLKKYKRRLLKAIIPYKEQSSEYYFNDMETNWIECKLEQIVDVYSGRDYKHLSKGNIPVYGTGGYILSVNEALSYKEDAIGIGRKGTIDKPYILKAPFWTVDTLFYVIPKEKQNLAFTYAIFQSIDWKKKDESTGVPSLSKAVIYDTDVYTTNHESQVIIGEFFSTLDKKIVDEENKLLKIISIKRGLLQQLFI